MSTHTSGEWLLLFVTALVVLFIGFTFKRQFWEAPLHHGPRYFLGVEVPPGFYEGAGLSWLRRYHITCLVVLSIVALALLAVLVSGRWFLLPVWAGGIAIFMTAVFCGFTVYTRRTLGANPAVRPRVAIPLEPRRLGDYISWPAEALMAVTIVLSWVLLLTRRGTQVPWNVPVLMTYVIVGLLPFKISVVRKSFPLPSEQTMEHYRWFEAERRLQLQVTDGFFRWFSIVILAGYALLAALPVGHAIVWLVWVLVGIALAVWLVSVAIMIRGSARLAGMRRDLRPIGSWSGPFRREGVMPPSYFSPYFAVYFAGLVLLAVFFRH